MNKLLFIILLLFLNFSCSDNKKNVELKEENNFLKTQLTEIKKKNTELIKQISVLKTLGTKNKDNQIIELLDSKIIKILDKRYSEDTLDLAKYGNEYIFKRDVELTKLDNKLFAETFGNIRERLDLLNYSTFSICDGKSLPLEMCNCTVSIYIVVGPENLGEDYELFRIGFFYNVDLISLQRIEKDGYEYDIELTFEHGKYPRKTEKMNLTKMKLEK
ncbi:hypothetical protein [Flavivirga spongiicola]|uniref:Uncharacterized protein n=1 Tax=Flavivirga spongiicola TaxID=421621 RepID=A0ABU7XNE5_9FLAO|nr:hypothetical protein [Flavivirga sp. MEBiC05379]MDO5981739.1 hypothetical protein [Flavivirga sp. MEBiC05379]